MVDEENGDRSEDIVNATQRKVREVNAMTSSANYFEAFVSQI